jgi:predicted deacylase
MKKLVFDSGKSGSTLLVTGAVHGNEVSGPLAIRQIAREIKDGALRLKAGKLILVPVVHEQAYRKNVRFVEINLNRVFARHANPTLLEHHVANEICRIVDECDVLLDLHSTHVDEDRPSIYLDYDTSPNRALALATGLGTACVGWPAMYEGRGEPGSTDYADQQGKSSILIECGGHNNPKSKEIALQSIRASLAHLGMAEIADLPQPAAQREDVLCEKIRG